MFPVISALKHHKTTVVLVALEIALTCAIVTNALFLIGDRISAMHVDTGVADNELVWASTSTLNLGDTGKPVDYASKAAADMAALRRIPGVKTVAKINALPHSGDGMMLEVYLHPGSNKPVDVTPYWGTRDMLRVLGIQLDEGRDFLPQEYANYAVTVIGKKQQPPTVCIVTRALAQHWWPGEDPLNKVVYLDSKGDEPLRVIGVVGHLLSPGGASKAPVDEQSLILPVKTVIGGKYVLRVKSAARVAVERTIPGVLLQVDPARIVTDDQIYTDTISQYFRGDRAMVWLLVVVIACLLALSALGVIGLSSFWVQGRTKTIGIRRAIGATRHDILRYFLVENFLIVGFGVVVGCLGAVGLNLWLMDHYELHRMPLVWLLAGAAILWLLGQLAVLGPALRASRVPPVVATRSV